MTIESTYRLQFHAGFTFRDAAAIVTYLSALGITHVYASPYLKARPGSTHGYDVIDHSKLSPELGTEADFEAFLAALKQHGMSHILDIVPNHVGVATNDNAWWNDVLENGPASRYAGYFDITWRGSPRPELHDKVLLPVLGDAYGDVLENGELKLVRADGKVWVRYFERRFPLDLRTIEPGEDVDSFNGTPGDPRSFDRLDALLDRQHYRLAHWHVASDEINYRRFFDINDLAALSMERREVFEATHALVLRLIREGKLAGVRVDHPDGLYDPKQYFQRLREAGVEYAVAEKILAVGEPLPSDWPVAGTSGYDALNMINGLFVDRGNEEAFTRIYQDWTGDPAIYDDLVYRNKLLILDISLASELQMLAYQLDRIAQRGRRTRDFTHNALRHVLREVIASFPVYRSYVSDEGVREADVKVIEEAIERAVSRNPKTDRSVFDFTRDVLLLRSPAGSRDAQRKFAGKFQQVTAPVTAKGIEDTTFYIYNRLISLNEVGGDPAHFGVTPAELHAYLTDRQKRWPRALTALSTHDTKRSEDVRARINVLAEMPDEWRKRVEHWGRINQHDGPPSRNDEYLLYQTLVGAWPLEGKAEDAFVKRIIEYLRKAMREAKVSTSWTSPNGEYESAVEDFIGRTIHNETFLASFGPFQRRVADFALTNTLAQTLLRLTIPGVPDTYQGTELIDLSLVDPDNRRPVDYARRQALLKRPEEDRKFFVTTMALHARREHPGLFSEGEYLPLEASGPRAEHVFAFARHLGGARAIVAVPRLVSRIGNWNNTTLRLPKVRARNVFTGRTHDVGGDGDGGGGDVPVGELFADFPVALLIAQR
jgi:(1->4)-alpha-D-glucan 1-alpha-D-glucosylmutase